jgi:hypothetical protein
MRERKSLLYNFDATKYYVNLYEKKGDMKKLRFLKKNI